MLNRTIIALLAGGTLFAIPAAAAPSWGSEPVPRAGACFYEHPNYRGRHFCARPGEEMPNIPNSLNDRISSIRVFGGGQVIVYSNGRFGGSQRWIDYNVSDLRNERWDDRISSARVSWRTHGNRYGANYRGDGLYRYDSSMTRDHAESIVRSAYLNVLGREPDRASGVWVDRVFYDRWSQRQVENELRNSAEYRHFRRVR